VVTDPSRMLGDVARMTTPANRLTGYECRLDICGKRLKDHPNLLHSYINLVDRTGERYNVFVDPSQHRSPLGLHSHAVAVKGGWDQSPAIFCRSWPSISCDVIDRLLWAVKMYEAYYVIYSFEKGPNSNSFIEWVLYESGFGMTEPPHSGLIGWDYYQRHPGQRSTPPTAGLSPAGPGSASQPGTAGRQRAP
jgi:hypothetical protein